MAVHKLQITYDESDGTLRIVHRCTSNIAGHDVSHAEELQPVDAIAMRAELTAMLDANRDAMELVAQCNAIVHAAAVSRVPQPGVKYVSVGGTVGGSGGSAVEKR